MFMTTIHTSTAPLLHIFNGVAAITSLASAAQRHNFAAAVFPVVGAARGGAPRVTRRSSDINQRRAPAYPLHTSAV